MAFAQVNMAIEWSGIGVDEKGICNGKVVVQINPEYFRPTEVDLLIGDATKAKRELGWTPTVHLPEMVAEMIEADLSLL
jgi:GDPmannose 4,6-dehydratase